VDQLAVATERVLDAGARRIRGLHAPSIPAGRCHRPAAAVLRSCARDRNGARMDAMTAAVGAGPCPEGGVDNAPDHNYCKHCGMPLKDAALERELGSGLAERTRDRCLALLKADANNPHVHHQLGLAYYHLGQIGNAIRAFERAIAIEDTYP